MSNLAGWLVHWIVHLLVESLAVCWIKCKI